MQLLKRDAGGAFRRSVAQTLDRPAPKDRQAWFRLASLEVDREETIVEPAGIDLRFHKQNPVVLWQHQSGTDEIGQAPPPDVVIGRVVEYDQAADHLDVLVEFDDDGPGGLANRVWAKVKKGLIRMVSLAGGIRKQDKRPIGGRLVEVYTEFELWEVSVVLIGALRSALRLDRGARTHTTRTLSRSTAGMDKASFCKAMGIEETAGREAAEDAVLDYLTTTTDEPDKRKAMRAALDEHFPESPSGEAGEGGASEGDEMKAMREALDITKKALKEAQDQLAGQGDAEEKAIKREAKLQADVDAWIQEGRVPQEGRATWLDRHRKGEAAAVVQYIERGTHTSRQRLRSGNVGTPVDVPAPEKAGPMADAEALSLRVEREFNNARVSALKA